MDLSNFGKTPFRESEQLLGDLEKELVSMELKEVHIPPEMPHNEALQFLKDTLLPFLVLNSRRYGYRLFSGEEWLDRARRHWPKLAPAG